MSSDEQIPVVADVENAKQSDGPSTAGEHSIDKVNDDETVPQSDEKSTGGSDEERKEETNGIPTEKNNDDNDNDNDGKINNNKRDIDQVDKDDDDEGKKNGQTEDNDQEATVSSSGSKKVKILDPLVNENGGSGESDDTAGTTAKVPNDELTVV